MSGQQVPENEHTTFTTCLKTTVATNINSIVFDAYVPRIADELFRLEA